MMSVRKRVIPSKWPPHLGGGVASGKLRERGEIGSGVVRHDASAASSGVHAHFSPLLGVPPTSALVPPD
uniref:Uncharacterized protein n=1 Tax=Timema bartmani TaxID=61472 RepID=A0A7R9ETR8_9NEOP|nr:unnamed protein product [Timema bartmani]